VELEVRGKKYPAKVCLLPFLVNSKKWFKFRLAFLLSAILP